MAVGAHVYVLEHMCVCMQVEILMLGVLDLYVGRQVFCHPGAHRISLCRLSASKALGLQVGCHARPAFTQVLFTWVLGIRTHALALAQQVPYPPPSHVE